MQITSSYKVEILKLHKPLEETLKVCRRAVEWLCPVIDGEWEALSRIRKEKERFNAAEKLIHTTKNNEAKYAFDEEFPKMPSYLRRAILQHVIGTVSSARSRAGEVPWNGACRRMIRNHYMPVFYKDNMYRKEEDRVYLKLYNGKDWIWQEIHLRRTDVSYLRKHWSGIRAKSPVLIKRYRKYFLQFAFEQSVELTKKEVEKQRICAVDLGINTDAVCSIMTADGTVAARKTAGAIIAFAGQNGADVIVFEHLEMKGKIRGKSRQKLHLWKKQAVQQVAEHQAHRLGMRLSRVCAWNTSALAFDGSGKLERDKKNHSLAVFRNGKQYNCDLSASYNIGARYFIREIIKPVPETERSALAAKVPAVQRRTSCVYADLLKLREWKAGAA